MVSVNQIREVVLDYVNNGDSDKFLLAFSKLSFNIRSNGGRAAIELARMVESKLAEVYVGHASQDALRRTLRDLVQPSSSKGRQQVLSYERSVEPSR